MTRVLLVASAHPAQNALAEALDRMPAGTTVDLALTSPKSKIGPVLQRRMHVVRVMRRPAARLRARFPAGLASPRWWRDLSVIVRSRLVARVGDAPARTWFGAAHDPWVRARAAEADVLVALDRSAVYAVWRLGRRHPGAAAVHGLDAAVRAVSARAAASSETASAKAS